MNKSIFLLSCCLLLASCSCKETFTGKWINLDDSLSVNSSEPVYFEALWYLVKNNENLCAVSTTKVQNQVWGSPKIYYGTIKSDKAILREIKNNNNQIILTVTDNRLSSDDDPKKLYEFVKNPIEKIIIKEGSIKFICNNYIDCTEMLYCEYAFNHLKDKEL